MNRPDYKFTADQYAAKVNTPSTSPVYYGTFIQPLLDEALEQNEHCHHVDVACGHAHAMEFVTKHDRSTNIKVTGIDLSETSLEEATTNFEENHPEFDISFKQADTENPLPELENTADTATAINAMVYKQAQMLKTLFNTLKPGAKCVVNFFLPTKNEAFIDFYDKQGMVVTKETLQVTANGQTADYPLTVTDLSGMQDENVRKLGRQSYISSTNAIEALCKQIGFDIVRHQSFHFKSSAINDIVDNAVYILQKPLTAGIEAPLAEIHEQIVQSVD